MSRSQQFKEQGENASQAKIRASAKVLRQLQAWYVGKNQNIATVLRFSDLLFSLCAMEFRYILLQ